MIAAREPGIVVDVEDRVAQALAEEGHRAVQAVLPFPGVAVEFVFHKDPCLPCRRSSSDRHEFFSSGPFASGHVASVGWPREALLSLVSPAGDPIGHRAVLERLLRWNHTSPTLAK